MFARSRPHPLGPRVRQRTGRGLRCRRDRGVDLGALRPHWTGARLGRVLSEEIKLGHAQRVAAQPPRPAGQRPPHGPSPAPLVGGLHRFSNRLHPAGLSHLVHQDRPGRRGQLRGAARLTVNSKVGDDLLKVGGEALDRGTPIGNGLH